MRGIALWASLTALFLIILFALPCLIWHVEFVWLLLSFLLFVVIPAKGDRCQRENNSATVC